MTIANKENQFENIDLRKQYFIELDKEIRELIDPKTGLLNENISKIINCPLCNQDNYEQLFIKRGYTFVRCKECGLVYVNPQVQVDKLDELYKVSKANDIWVKVTLDPRERAWKRDYYYRHLELLLSLSEVKPVSLLDIGCSTGQFMEIANQRGLNVCGLELNKLACEYVSNVLGLTVFNTKIEDVAISPDTFDICTLFGVLEHLPEPLAVLKQAVKLTRNGGLILSVVPNVYSLFHMIIQEKSVTFDGRNHLIYYSLDTIKALYEKAGLEVIHSDTVLTGLPGIIRQVQFIDHELESNEKKYLPSKLKKSIENGILNNDILKYDLGLRIRIVGKVKKI